MATVNQSARNFFFNSTLELRLALGLSLKDLFGGYIYSVRRRYQNIENAVFAASQKAGVETLGIAYDMAMLSQYEDSKFPETKEQQDARYQSTHGWEDYICRLAHHYWKTNWDGFGLTGDNAHLFAGGTVKRRMANAMRFDVQFASATIGRIKFPEMDSLTLAPAGLKYRSDIFRAAYIVRAETFGDSEAYRSLVGTLGLKHPCIDGMYAPNAYWAIVDEKSTRAGILSKIADVSDYCDNVDINIVDDIYKIAVCAFDRKDRRATFIEQLANVRKELESKNPWFLDIPAEIRKGIYIGDIFMDPGGVAELLKPLSGGAAQYKYKIMGETSCGKTTMKVVEKADTLNLRIGNLTACCQKIGGAGEKVCIDGWIDPHSINYAFWQDGRIVAHMWTWVSKCGLLVIDSIEGVKSSRPKDIAHIVMEMAKSYGRKVAISKCGYGLTDDVIKEVKKHVATEDVACPVPIFDYRYMDADNNGVMLIL